MPDGGSPVVGPSTGQQSATDVHSLEERIDELEQQVELLWHAAEVIAGAHVRALDPHRDDNKGPGGVA
jgi:hypothetical protein